MVIHISTYSASSLQSSILHKKFKTFSITETYLHDNFRKNGHCWCIRLSYTHFYHTIIGDNFMLFCRECIFPIASYISNAHFFLIIMQICLSYWKYLGFLMQDRRLWIWSSICTYMYNHFQKLCSIFSVFCLFSSKSCLRRAVMIPSMHEIHWIHP